MNKKPSVSKHVLWLPLVLALTFMAHGQEAEGTNKEPEDGKKAEHFGSYKPNAGFKLVNTEYGDLNLKIYAYVRYLNQHGLNDTSTDSFGQTSRLDLRQDIQLNKVNIQFLGWILDPKLRYIFYVWTNNTAQGLGAQVVVAGNLSYAFCKNFTLGIGVNSLPGVRSTEGSFPFWLTLDNRLMADEFFRPSYTMGIWAKGEVVRKLNYSVMLGNNLSQLGVDAGQLDDGINTFSAALTYFPTTGEYGLNSNFGDFENHRKAATRVGAHFTRSDEDRQGQPNTDAFENVQIRLSDGNVIFKPNLFGDGVQIERATYQMAGFDIGVKYRGFALEAEFYWRRIDRLTGPGVDSLAFDELNDHGYQAQGSGMIIPGLLQLYATWSKVLGEYGNPWEYRAGLNYYPWKNHVVRANMEYIYQDRCPVGGLSLPYQVGGTGSIFHANLQVNF
jgi:hypothetical protein